MNTASQPASEAPRQKADGEGRDPLPSDFVRALREAGAPRDLIQAAEGVDPAEIRKQMSRAKLRSIIAEIRGLLK